MTRSGGRQRQALRNGDVVGYTLSYLLAVVAEWSVFLGVLVYAYERDGARAAGLASLAILVPYVIGAPIASAAAERYPPARVRIGGLAVQTVAYGAAAVAASREVPTAVVVAFVMIALVAATTLRPAGAALLPAIVRTSRELTVANLWQTYCESASDIAGPLLATVLLYAGGPTAVIAGSAVAAALAVIVALARRPLDPPGGSDEADRVGGLTVLKRQVAAIRARPGVGGVLAVEGGHFVLVGGLDIIVVVMAAEQLDLGQAGAGVLSTAFGVGALASMFVATALTRRKRLAPVLSVGLVVVAIAAIVVGSVTSVAVALIMLGVIGLVLATINVLAQMLLQRSAPPEELAAVFAVIELACGAGVVIGSLLAQTMIALSGTRAAMIGMGVVMLALMLATARALRHADATATIPVVAMSLLRRLPVFAPLPPIELEAVARSANEVHTEPAQPIVTQGEHGDSYYAVADGEFDVTIDGRLVRTITRGGGFGEIALLADVPRTATVMSRGDGALLEIGRVPFLVAVTGHDSSRQAAWGAIRHLDFGDQGSTWSIAPTGSADPDQPESSGGSVR